MLTHETDMPRADQPRHDAGRRPDQSPPPADTPAPHDSPAPTEEKAVRETAPDATPATADSWREVQPELDALWQRHLERWPESERPPADRTKDEPGSWRGDGGQFLNAEENIVVSHGFGEMHSVERELSPTLRDVEAMVPDAELVGFTNRIKGEDRFKEKVAEGIQLKPEREILSIIRNLPDALRYTYILDSQNYLGVYNQCRQSLQDRGFEQVFCRNTWGSLEYKGANTRWRTQEGQLFEVQFHTMESYEAKQLSHTAYERLRNPQTDKLEMRDLREFQRTVSSKISIPAGVQEIPDFRLKGY